MKTLTACNKALFFLLILMSASLGLAEDDMKGLKETQASLQGRLQQLESYQKKTAALEARMLNASGHKLSVMETRLAKSRIELIKSGLDYVKELLKQEGKAKAKDQSKAVTDFFDDAREKAVEILLSHRDLVTHAYKGIEKNIDLPERGLPVAEEAAAYTRVFHANAKLNVLYHLFIQSIDMAIKLDLDVTEEKSLLILALENRAENIAVLLELASEDIRGIQAGVAVLPADLELKARQAITEVRVRSLARALLSVVSMMKIMDMKFSDYSELAIEATGQITTEALESGVISGLLLGWGEKMTTLIVNKGPNLLLNVLVFILIIFLSRKLSRLSEKVALAALARSNNNLSVLLRRMLVSILGNVVFIFGVLIALSQIGISLGPLLAGLGVAGFVVGFAMQDVLSNFASGMMILIYRPFDVGDMVEAGGVFGRVNQMSLVSTTILTLDNQTIVVPNNKIWGDVVKNMTSQKVRRVDLMFGVSYSSDVAHVERVLKDIVDADERVLDEPAPLIQLHEMADSSVNFILRPWVNTEDYWDVYWHLMRTVKIRFDEEGISIPFPQRDLHFDPDSPIAVALNQLAGTESEGDAAAKT